MAVGPHCDGCGRLTSECSGCRTEHDPPRFCPVCGVRMAVLVTPNGYRSRCQAHGVIDTAGPSA